MPLFRDDAGCNQTKERRLRVNRWRKPISEKNVLLGDIGATNARFAVLTEGRVGSVRTLEVARFPRFVEAVALVRNELQGAMNIQAAAVAVAGPVSDGRCVLTNCSWIIDAREFYDSFHIKASVVNDFEAAAYSLPLLGPSDLVADRAADRQNAEVARLQVELDRKNALILASRARDELRKSSTRRIVKLVLDLISRARAKCRKPMWRCRRTSVNSSASPTLTNSPQPRRRSPRLDSSAGRRTRAGNSTPAQPHAAVSLLTIA